MVKIKFSSKKIGSGETFLVGMCPNKQRKSNSTGFVWEGNRSGDVMSKIIEGFDNLFLTNVFNYYTDSVIDKSIIDDGKAELLEDIRSLNPKKIVCFGDFAFKEVNTLQLKNVKVVKVTHPSYILRFNIGVGEYIKSVRSEIGNSD
ncbi:MAG: hypothetical protein Q7R52_02455 [archaeon]|nr:hypothetical protein [archaeon]